MGKSARDQGADGLFVAPIPVQTNRALANFYRTVAAEVGLPVFIHDFPESFGVTVPAELVTELAQDDSQVVGIKLEEKPVLPKLSAIRAASAEFRIFGGLGGVYCLEELGRGASGIMTGFAFPQILVEIYNAYTSGDVQRATELFDRYATLLRYEFQPKIGLGFRKHLYWRRGVFETTTVRPPSPPVDDQSLKELDQIVERLGLTP
jgi:4-hydroxy-tetrahydrodipicolinate synthase